MADFVNKGQAMRSDWANSVVTELRSSRKLIDQTNIVIRKGGGSNAAGCPFGTITSNVSASYIKGGVVYAGINNFNIEDFKLPTSAGDKVYYFQIPVTVNMDDDSEILLPNIKESSWTPTWANRAYSSGYPSNTAPTIPSGEGTIIVPLGRVVIESIPDSDPAAYSYKFTPTNCGNITVNHCAGTLSHIRS
jgi:hypothetical protein